MRPEPATAIRPRLHLDVCRMTTFRVTRHSLDRLYRRYNRRRYINPDPLVVLYRYQDLPDREIVGLVASSLAFGRVAQILRSADRVLRIMGPSPAAFLDRTGPAALRRAFGGFRHRYADGGDLAELLTGIKRVIRRHGSLNRCLVSHIDSEDRTVLPALAYFVRELGCAGNRLVPDPSKGSACKRLHLFLRWMVRKDAVDPGGWKGVSPRQLVIPLDTHMARIGRRLGLTCRQAPNAGMALDMTEAFRRLEPDDPVKFDFALTRFGIRTDLDMNRLCAVLQGAEPKNGRTAIFSSSSSGR